MPCQETNSNSHSVTWRFLGEPWHGGRARERGCRVCGHGWKRRQNGGNEASCSDAQSFLRNGCWLFSTEISLHAGHWIFCRYWSCPGTRILWASSSIRSSGPGQANLLHYSRVNDEPIFVFVFAGVLLLCWCVLLLWGCCWQRSQSSLVVVRLSSLSIRSCLNLE